jgi:hypothetical protein
MDKENKYKQLLINLCITIIIIIILRFLYIRLSNNNKYKEGFESNTNNGDAIDLLSKYKTNQIIVDNNVLTDKNIIKPWTTKIYNMQSITKQSKEIALYKPNLFINNEQYCKLGDTLSQNTNYSPPNSSQLTLLIKKGVSDIKPPKDYDLIVNFGSEFINTKFYEFESYIDDISKMNLIATNINTCSKTFVNMNTIVQKNVETLQLNLSQKLINEPTFNMIIDNKTTSIIGLVNNTINNFNTKNTSNITLPAGVSGSFTKQILVNNEISTEYADVDISFDIPSKLDDKQTGDKTQIISYLPTSLFKNISENNIKIKTFEYNLFHLIPVIEILNYLQSLCDNIKTIYDNQNNNVAFLNYLNLTESKDTVLDIMDKIEVCKTFLSTYDNVNTITLTTNPEVSTYYNTIVTSIPNTNTLLGLVLEILKNMKLIYKVSFFKFNIANVIIPETFSDIPSTSNTIEHFSFMSKIGKPTATDFANAFGGGSGGSGGSRLTKGIKDGIKGITGISTITQLKLTSFNNDFLSNIPKNNYDINYNTTYSTQVKGKIMNIINFAKFQSDLNNNSIQNLPLKIYRPIPPIGYRALGHIFCNVQRQLNDIKNIDIAGNGVCCVPEHCVKDIRDWNSSDKVFEYNKNNTYWALYFNPFIGTFISTNKNQLPEGKVSKVVACVKKCSAVDDLEKADECARNYYNINKKIKSDVNMTPNLVADQEELFYLEKLKSQGDSIARLTKRAQDIQMNVDKANIVNREMNKNKLQTYVDTQKRNIDSVMKRLEKDKNSIQTNISIPVDVLNKLISYIQKSKDIPEEQKVQLVSKLLNNQKMMKDNLITKTDYENTINKVLSACPNYDLTGLVKKSIVSDVCYGCDSPK